jgi:hypothetical protein
MMDERRNPYYGAGIMEMVRDAQEVENAMMTDDIYGIYGSRIVRVRKLSRWERFRRKFAEPRRRLHDAWAVVRYGAYLSDD